MMGVLLEIILALPLEISATLSNTGTAISDSSLIFKRCKIDFIPLTSNVEGAPFRLSTPLCCRIELSKWKPSIGRIAARLGESLFSLSHTASLRVDFPAAGGPAIAIR